MKRIKLSDTSADTFETGHSQHITASIPTEERVPAPGDATRRGTSTTWMEASTVSVGRGNRPARLHKRADTRLLGLINEMQPAEMPSRGAVACRRKDYIDAHLGG